MTKELIERLRNDRLGVVQSLGDAAADALEALQDQLTTERMNCVMADESVKRLAARVVELEAENSGNMETCKGIIAGLTAELAAVRAQKPVAYLRFWAAQRVTQDGNVDADEGFEVCRVQDIGADKQPAFPVFSNPIQPVREPLTNAEIERIARAHGTGGWQTLADMQKFARAVGAAIKE